MTEFWEKSKLVSSDFSMMKNIVAPLDSSFPIKLLCCGYFNLACLLKSMRQFQRLVHNSLEKCLLSPTSVLANNKTNNLLTFVNVGSIK